MLTTCFFVIKLYNIIKKENVFGQWTDFAKVLKGDIDCQFAIVNKTYGTLTQLTTTNGGSYINVEINNSGTIILCIPGVAFHMPIWGSILILVGAVVIVAGVVVTIIAATKRKKQNMNSY